MFSHAVTWLPDRDDRADNTAARAGAGPDAGAHTDRSAAASRAAGARPQAAVGAGSARPRRSAELILQRLQEIAERGGECLAFRPIE